MSADAYELQRKFLSSILRVFPKDNQYRQYRTIIFHLAHFLYVWKIDFLVPAVFRQIRHIFRRTTLVSQLLASYPRQGVSNLYYLFVFILQNNFGTASTISHGLVVVWITWSQHGIYHVEYHVTFTTSLPRIYHVVTAWLVHWEALPDTLLSIGTPCTEQMEKEKLYI